MAIEKDDFFLDLKGCRHQRLNRAAPLLRVDRAVAETREEIVVADVELTVRGDEHGSPPFFRVIAGHASSLGFLQRNRVGAESVLQKWARSTNRDAHADEIRCHIKNS